MFKKFKKSILTALVVAIALPLILALYLLLPKNNAITAQAEEALTVSTAEELSAQLSASNTVTVQLTSDISSETTFTVSGNKILDLNGYVVTFTGETGSVISVAAGAEFTLKDSNPTKENTVGEKTVYGGVITGGKALGRGGGIYVNSNAVFTMKGGNVSGNTATVDINNYIGGGGGVYVGNGSFTMEGGNISGNTSTASYYHGGGGGVYVIGGSFTMKGGSISGNTAAGNYSAGGGVYVKNASFKMEDGAISDNICNDRGGGVYVENDSPATGDDGESDFTMKGGSISGNTSEADYSGYGGGVYVKNASFKMEKGAISDNVAQLNGGGVYVENGSFTMEVGSISGNKTTSSNGYGGGVYVYENATFTMNGGTIDKNEASNGGGVYVVANGSRFEMTDSEISGNKSRCGGGIYIASGAEAEIHGGSIRNNIADGSNGGGINVSGTISIYGTEISGCSASTAGGINVEMGATANISKVTITGCSNLNLDENGNAISIGSAICSYGGTIRLTDGNISGNTKGAAIFWVGPEFTISGAPYIYGNEDGDLVPSGPMYTIENLQEDAKIGIACTPPTGDGVFTMGGAINEDNIKCFYSNDQKCITVLNGEASVSGDHVYAEPVWSWADDCTSATAEFTCDNCQHVETVTASGEDIESEVTTPATCTSTGETAYTATVEFNGETETDTKPIEVEALPHDYTDSTNYNSDGTQHWKICKDCTAEDTDNKEDCDGGEATCTAKAVCLTCGNEYGDLDENNHAWGKWSESKAATCTEKGEEQRVCSHDATHKETREINAKNHNWGEWTVSKAATCTEKGEEQRVCTNDATHKETRETDAKNHSYGDWSVSKEATCTEKGEEARICSNDNTHKETRETDAKNHNWGEWTVSKEATVEEYGEEQRVCSNDGTHIETRQTDKIVAPVVPENNDGLSTGALAGIIVASILLLLLLIYIVCYFALYRREVLLKGKFFDVIYAPMNAIFGKKKKDEEKEETENS